MKNPERTQSLRTRSFTCFSVSGDPDEPLALVCDTLQEVLFWEILYRRELRVHLKLRTEQFKIPARLVSCIGDETVAPAPVKEI